MPFNKKIIKQFNRKDTKFVAFAWSLKGSELFEVGSGNYRRDVCIVYGLSPLNTHCALFNGHRSCPKYNSALKIMKTLNRNVESIFYYYK